MVHALFRWVVVIVGVVTFVRLIVAVLQKSPFTNLDRRLTLGFTISMDIEVLLGVITILLLGFSQARIEHAVTMLLALVAAHLPSRWRNAPDRTRFLYTLGFFTASLILIFIGVSIVNGWVA
jgi:hypothetical protein